MTLSPEQAAFVERYPFALSSYITDDMQPRIAERMKETAYAEGHRSVMPPSSKIAQCIQTPETASIASCILNIVKQRNSWTFAELRTETGIGHNKLQYGLDVNVNAGKIIKIETRGQRHRYTAVKP